MEREFIYDGENEFREENPASVYLIECLGFHKIGMSENISARLKAFSTCNPFPCSLIHSFVTKFPSSVEYYLHKKLKIYHVKNEWFKLPYQVVNDFMRIKNHTHPSQIKNLICLAGFVYKQCEQKEVGNEGTNS